VVHNGRLVAERYADGFTAGSRFLGWSMSKSVTALLLGTLVDSGRLDLAAPAPLATWRTAADGHQQITLTQLLDMTSGLSFRETYAPGDDATRMLYSTDDMGAFAAGQPMAAAPGTVWSYSSGTANILARLLFDASGGSLATVYDYARTHLFEPAGMTSAVFEPDAAGVPVGSSYLYMTARDWARFGLLVLGRGSIGWHRILSPDWIAATATPARTLDGQPHPYARQFWLNYAEDSTRATALPHCPPDTIMADGHNGQLVAIVPSAHTVVVRLAWDTGPTRFDSDQTLSAILTALKSD
jgi:CubicO group peptidase (beta-lactamase class C family)